MLSFRRFASFDVLTSEICCSNECVKFLLANNRCRIKRLVLIFSTNERAFSAGVFLAALNQHNNNNTKTRREAALGSTDSTRGRQLLPYWSPDVFVETTWSQALLEQFRKTTHRNKCNYWYSWLYTLLKKQTYDRKSSWLEIYCYKTNVLSADSNALQLMSLNSATYTHTCMSRERRNFFCV